MRESTLSNLLVSVCLALFVLAPGGRVEATVVDSTVPPGGEVTLFLDPGTTDNETGIRVVNEGSFSFKVEIEGVEVVDPADAVAPGFRLLDNTLLRVTTTPSADGRMKAGIGIEFDPARLRAGERPRNLVLMRREKESAALWRPIPWVMRKKGYTPRKMDKSSPRLALYGMGPIGEYGVDLENQCVWAVVDVGGSYAIGIPEPITVALLGTGAGLLLCRRKWRLC